MVAQTLSRSESGVRADAPRKRLFTREEYHAMGEAGVLGHRERVELLEGEIVVMSPIESRHSACVLRMAEVFYGSGSLAGRAHIHSQSPVAVSDTSELEPDLMILAYLEDRYALRHPRPQDILLLLEVSDSSLNYDRDVKLPRYAEVGIREGWIVNLQDDCIEAHTEPTAEGYGGRRIYRPGESVAPTAFPDLKIAVSDIIPSRASGQ